MKIDSEFINKIFNLKIKLKKESDKIKLSKYEELIPMYDIYSQKIYPINKQNLHYRLIESHYRFINKEIYDWLKYLYDKYNKDEILGPRFKNNLEILTNYDIEILFETSYKALYKYSSSLGLLVSICKRNSFHPFMQHLKPYYTKTELIKLGQNMNIIKSELDPEYLIDQETHYNICKKISNNDVSFNEIKTHQQYIIDTNLISWICFYSFTGSFLFNKYLRNTDVTAIRSNLIRSNILNKICDNYYYGLYNIVNKMKDAPELENDYDMYRFIWDDRFLQDLKIGDIFLDKGFMSTTRDPFYSPGLTGSFGLVLLKIKIPKNKKGLGLFIENFSLFPKEEEYLLPPYSKIKLISKDEHFKYYHTNPEFEKLINKKYEFELLDIDYELFYKENKLFKTNNKKFNDIESINIDGISRIDIIKQFIQSYSNNDKINLKLKNNNYEFNYQWFDSTESYEKFYYNKIKEGIIFSLFDENGYPYLNIELGNELVINYLNKFYFGNSSHIIDNKELDIIYHFGRIFNYKIVKIFHEYSNFTKLNYSEISPVFLNSNLYNKTIYNYLKYGKQYFENNTFINYDIGYWYVDEYFNKKVDQDIINKLPTEIQNINTNKQLFIILIEKYFYLYSKIIDSFDKTIFKNSYVNYDIYERLLTDGLITNFKPELNYETEHIPDENFKLIFRQPIRRF